MPSAQSLRTTAGAAQVDDLYQRIGQFLADQHLEPNPVNYAFAYHVIADPTGALATEVEARIDGGVRLTQRDIADLGVTIDRERAGVARETPARAADLLVAETQMQVEQFVDMMSSMQAETRDFGRDLIASADALERGGDAIGSAPEFLDRVARITQAMVGRVTDAERRLEQATHETQMLRRKLEEARGDALRDPLTGLPNRRAFEQAYAAGVDEGRAMCLAVCDVDHFKRVNDEFGHAVGDRVLRSIALTLTEACEGHFVARYGGEEFAVLFYAAPGDAAAVMEAARSQVAGKRYRVRETDAPLGEITFSAGVTEAAPADPLDAAFQRADRLLYAAKADGRNRVVQDGAFGD
ncbi:GGDEF domain-containing protein [Sphingomonas baiyangensis]|uniref:diguanylate cyclase n=1 Tax=Sphingomonas baiyangensis TaxID=2572576 RepID=A0A4U1L8B9_9SPHN|nr:GGDEF domain-containing protein [Sphingomonas baiyangensis]TKD53207.1 GGDEF domain-containing protein [Sphingomonas baiyangensis]